MATVTLTVNDEAEISQVLLYSAHPLATKVAMATFVAKGDHGKKIGKQQA
ncbi:MAG: hypothetical protein M0021_02565 [Clostridia bacterium]|nr:hypothetical protein [Clostridia bacterium]